MKKGKGYGEFSYSSRRFKKALGLLCAAAVFIPALSMRVQASETAPVSETVPVQTDGGWAADTGTAEAEPLPEALDFGFFIPQVSIYYGQQLKAAALSGTATDEQGQTVNGTFSWLYPETVMEQLGTVVAEAVFTPSPAAPAGSGTALGGGWISAEISAGQSAQTALPKQYLSVHVKVEPAPVDIVEAPWTATPLKKGLVLKDIRLEGGMAMVGYPAPYGKKADQTGIVSGSFSWAEPDYALEEGKQDVKVIFTPDRKEYQPGETVLTLEVPEEQKPEKPQMPRLYLSCPDIFYGETVRAEAWADGDTQPFITYSYKGKGRTVYPESQTPPKEPGEYIAYAEVHESELFEPVFLEEDFTIKRAVPKMEISADRTEVKGGGRVNLRITVRNMHDSKLKEGLPAASGLRWSFEGKPAVRHEQEIKGSDGTYTAAFSVPDENGTVTCRVYMAGNSFYESSEAAVTVQVRKNDKPSGGNKDEGGSKDDGKHDSHKKDEEEEPAVKTPEEVEAEFWQDVIFRIYKAQEKGETVTINAKGHGQMPDKVMEALRGHKKVTLALVWDGDMIFIPAGKAPAAKKGGAAWTLMELSKSYPAPKPADAKPQKPAAENKPSQSKPVVNQPSKPVAQSQSGPSNVSGGSGNHSGTAGGSSEAHPESSEAESTEHTEETAETESTEETTEGAGTEESIQESESAPEEAADSEKKTDWLTIAACVCAGAGLVAVLVAIAALVLKKKGEL